MAIRKPEILPLIYADTADQKLEKCERLEVEDRGEVEGLVIDEHNKVEIENAIAHSSQPEGRNF